MNSVLVLHFLNNPVCLFLSLPEDEEEASSLAQSLTMVRELLSSIDQQVPEHFRIGHPTPITHICVTCPYIVLVSILLSCYRTHSQPLSLLKLVRMIFHVCCKRSFTLCNPVCNRLELLIQWRPLLYISYKFNQIGSGHSCAWTLSFGQQMEDNFYFLSGRWRIWRKHSGCRKSSPSWTHGLRLE